MIKIAQDSGTGLPPATASELEELYVIRLTLEAETVRLSVPRLTDRDLARLDELIAQMNDCEKRDDLSMWVGSHRCFHRLLTTRTGPRLRRVLDQLCDQTDPFERFGIRAATRVGHREILDACIVRDRNKAGALLARHLAHACLDATALIEPGYDAARLKMAVADVGCHLAAVPDDR